MNSVTDKCLNLSVIPQFSGSCWFNSILTICLYSQHTRKVLLKYAKKWDKTNTFLMIIKSILIKYYYQPSKVQDFFKKIKPEIILFKMLKKYNEDNILDFMKQNIKQNISNVGWFESHIITFFKYLSINSLDIIYFNGNYILNFDGELYYKYNNFTGELKKILKHTNIRLKDLEHKVYTKTKAIVDKVPDILIVTHENLNSSVRNEYIPLLNQLNSDIFEHKHYNCKIKGIDTYDDIIYFNGYKYKLDATTLVNYNTNSGMLHAIAGITCNNNHYVYNGWQSTTTDPAMRHNIDKGLSTSPCSLMPYNWNIKKDQDFCLNPKTCKLDFGAYVNPATLCFSFAKGDKTLIYVRINDTNVSDSAIAKNISIPTSLNISKGSEMLKDIHDFDKMTDYDLIIELNKFGVYLVDGYYYSRHTLENLYLNELKKYYNLTDKVIQSENIRKKKLHTYSDDKKKKMVTKQDLINLILIKYPNAKKLNTKTKAELNEILQNGIKDKTPKTKKITKNDLIAILRKKYPSLKGVSKLTIAQIKALI